MNNATTIDARTLGRIQNSCTSDLIDWNNTLVLKIENGECLMPEFVECTLNAINAELESRGI